MQYEEGDHAEYACQLPGRRRMSRQRHLWTGQCAVDWTSFVLFRGRQPRLPEGRNLVFAAPYPRDSHPKHEGSGNEETCGSPLYHCSEPGHHLAQSRRVSVTEHHHGYSLQRYRNAESLGQDQTVYCRSTTNRIRTAQACDYTVSMVVLEPDHLAQRMTIYPFSPHDTSPIPWLP